MNPSHQTIGLLRNELGVVLSSTLARLLLAAVLGGTRPGMATAAQASGAAHEHFHLFWRGHVHGTIGAAPGHADGQRTDRGTDHPGYRLHRRRLESGTRRHR